MVLYYPATFEHFSEELSCNILDFIIISLVDLAASIASTINNQK